MKNTVFTEKHIALGAKMVPLPATTCRYNTWA